MLKWLVVVAILAVAAYVVLTNVNIGLILTYLSHKHSANTTGGGGITLSWLAQESDVLNGTAPYPTQKGDTLLAVSYSQIRNASINQSAANADLKMLLDANVSAVRIDLNYDPWIDNNATQIGAYDAFINEIRASGKSLVIADAAGEYYRSHRLSWSAFKTAWVQRVKTIAARYHPDYYIVIKEPGWYFAMLNDPLNPPVNASDWTNLTEQLISAVRNVSPNTKIGVSVDAEMRHDVTGLNLNYFLAARNISGLDFMGFDIYTASAWNDTAWFLSTYGTGNKQRWIAEAWSTTSVNEQNQSRSELDAQWIKTLYLFAESEHMQYIFPFFTNDFASYRAPPANFSALVSFYQNRTPAFYAYKNITPINNS
ncbi:MAG: hypothetical protein KGH57_00540 [Candidatus Micrarchaeota archaeon]|nr:hypothetical protein [Candidatus Micrarchaeota archaeon]